MFSIPGLSIVKRWAIELGGILFAALAAFLYGLAKGSRAGVDKVIAKNTNAIQKTQTQKSEVEQSIKKLPIGQAQQELNKSWSRD